MRTDLLEGELHAQPAGVLAVASWALPSARLGTRGNAGEDGKAGTMLLCLLLRCRGRARLGQKRGNCAMYFYLYSYI